MASRNLPIIDWLEIESSAPGKFIVSGEYSVVYEKQAIAAAVDLRTRVTIRPNKDGKVRLNLKSLTRGNCREWPTSSLTTYRLIAKYSECLEYNDTMPVKLNHLLHTRFHGPQESSSTPITDPEAIGQESDNQRANETKSSSGNRDLDKKADDAAMAFLLLYIGLGDSYCGSARPPIDVDVESDVPVGSGLGSSSAYSVSLCGALMRVFRVAAEKYIISNWAFNIDKFFHGKPSGVDNNVVSYGGYILFQNGKIKILDVTHKHPIKVMLIDTCVSRSTRSLSENVIAQLRENPAKINGLFNSINDLTTQIWRKINHPDFTPRTIAECLKANQEHLDALGVGHEKLTDIFNRAREYNFEAKQTGAGGGGTAFIMYELDNSKNIELLEQVLVESGYKVRTHSIGCEGLLVKLVPDPDKRFATGDR